jgi:hypothetical protein
MHDEQTWRVTDDDSSIDWPIDDPIPFELTGKQP